MLVTHGSAIRWTAVALTTAVLLAACAQPDAGVADARWRVDSVPTTVIGVASGDPRYELDVANSALRLGDGRIVVANSGTHDLRFYDPTGNALLVTGRDGDGPGEYRGTMALYEAGSDSLVVYSNGNSRYSVVDDSGRFAHTMQVETAPGGPFPWDDWLTSATWVRGVRDRSLRPCVARVLRGLTAVDSIPVRRALVDDLHAVWVQPARSAYASSHWTVYPIEGGSTISVDLPAGVELYQAGKDFVLGRRLDGDGVEQIVVYALHDRQAATPASCAPASSSPDSADLAESSVSADPTVVAHMQAELRNFLVSQEMYFAMHGGYAGSSDSTSWQSASGNRIWVVRADRTGWFGFMTGPGGAGPLCATGVGAAMPPGWDAGVARCGN